MRPFTTVEVGIVDYVYPQDWERFGKIPVDAYKKFGLHYATAVCTPAWLLGRAVFISFHEFITMNNPLTHARLGDSNSRSVEGLKRIIPKLQEEEVKVAETRKFLGLISKVTYIRTNPVDYDVRLVGDVPIGLSGSLVTGAKALAKSIPILEKMALETKQYFDFARYGAGVKVTVRSLGGTEILNRAFEHLQEVKPIFRIEVWIIDEKHPNLKALIAYALKARKNKPQKSLVVLRINKGDIEKGDIALARSLNGLLSQHGAKGKPDLSTLIRSLIERYKGILHYTYKTVDISLTPTQEKTRIFGITIRKRRGKDVKEEEKVVKIVTQALDELPPSDSRQPYFIFGAFTDQEVVQIEDEAKAYVGNNPLYVVPTGSPLKAIDGRSFVKSTIVRFDEGYSKLKALFNYRGDEIPDEVLDKAIKENNDVANGLIMASRFFGLDDVIDFIGGDK
jgi:hypothetical protein